MGVIERRSTVQARGVLVSRIDLRAGASFSGMHHEYGFYSGHTMSALPQLGSALSVLIPSQSTFGQGDDAARMQNPSFVVSSSTGFVLSAWEGIANGCVRGDGRLC